MLPGTGFMAVEWTIVIIACSLLINRMFVKFTLRNDRDFKSDEKLWDKWKWSDYLVLVAWCFNVVQATIDTTVYTAGGLSDAEYNGEMSGDFGKIGFAQDTLYYISPYCIKLAILKFYLEILDGVQILVGVRRATYVGMGFSVFGLIFTELNYLLECRPISNNWSDDYDGYCWASPTLTFAIAWHMFTDIYIYTIPFFLISQIKLNSTSKKISTILMFASGFVLVLLAVPNFINTFTSVFDGSIMWCYWVGIFELNVGVIIACLPSAKKTWNKVFYKPPPLNLRRPSHWAAKPLMARRAQSVGLNGTTLDEEQEEGTVLGGDSVDWGRNMSATMTNPEPWERDGSMGMTPLRKARAPSGIEKITFSAVNFDPKK